MNAIVTRTAALAALAALGLVSPACAQEKAEKAAAEQKAEAPAAEKADAAAAAKPAVKEGAALGPGAPVAVVNGQPVSKGEYDRALKAYMRNFAQATGGMHGKVTEPNEQMKADVLEQLVDRELLYQESRKFPAEKAGEQAAAELEQIKARFPSPEAFQQALASDQLTEGDLKDLIGRQVSVRHYVETEIAPKVEVKQDAIAAFYKENEEKFATPEQVQCSHILIRVEQDAKPEAKEAAKKKAQDIQVRCAKGEDFAALAKEFSEDPGSKESGGDLGFFGREQMVAPFSEAAFALKPGQVSNVVETRFGYHVIKLTERKEASKRGLEEVQDQIKAYLNSRALDQAVQGRVAELKAAAKIDVLAPHL